MKIEALITDNIDVWTSAIKKRSATGRGSNKKIELTGIKKLRELILELAVRGKLVPQDSNDEPASVLLEKIAAEKVQLIKDKKIKKTKALPEIVEGEKSFELPNGWEWMRLGYGFNSIISGGTPSKRDPSFWNGDIPWASVKDLGREKYISKTQDYITKEGLVSGSKLAGIGDILICTRMGLGKIAIATNPIAFNQDLKAVKLTSKLDVDFFINSYSTLKIKGTGTTVAGIKQEELLSYVIGLPPLPEQHRIVAKVDELMLLCDQLEQQTEDSITAHQTLVKTLLATLSNSENSAALTAKDGGNEGNAGAISFESNWTRIAEHFDTLFTTEHSIDQLKQTILQLAVMGKLVPQNPNDEPASILLEKIAAEKELLIEDKKIKKQKPLPAITEDEKPFELPSGWKFAYFYELVLRMGSGSTPRGGKSAYKESGIPFLRSQNVRNEGLDLHDVAYINDAIHKKMSNTVVYPNDLLLNITGGSLGRSAIFPSNIGEANVSQHVSIIRPFEILNVNFMHLCILSPYIQGLIWGRQVGMAREGLSKKVLELFEFPLPPLPEQHRIVKKVDELMALCDQLKARLNDAQTTQLHLADTIVEQAVS